MLAFSAPLSVKEQKIFGSGWKIATYTSAEGDKFDLFPLESFTSTGGVIFGDAIPPRISPTGKYAVIDVRRAGVVDPGPSGKPEVQTRQYCPVLETKTGCVVSSQSGELCEGQWGRQGDRWVVSGLTDDASDQMLKHQFSSANELWNGFANSTGKPFHLSIQETVSSNLGVYNLVACDRPSVNNVTAYRNIAMELKKSGDNESAEYIAMKLESVTGQVEHVKSHEISVQRAFLFDKPSRECQTKMYLIKGDNVKIINKKDGGWLRIEYTQKSGRSIQRWIRSESIN
ncbi:hypothetical protein [Burkholderia dolosa]|uniref:hypothetical protein n=1 Tax=Burkholderia dolosa TaxID=152500 RepID=UPI001590F059|nr:hypothetical protein [Burkholderia dolosa]MBR8299560.1 hypothetical protein [Burkholderia dolosa]MBR8458890.1 hypothetical protein [Burkholderia dolosa]MBY4752566.1 hypothetical protein [Burkholderia dolosa]MDN7421153.1 hypothetical protein [Burkholderia dolosa]